LFEQLEHRYNEKVPWAPLVSDCGGNLQFVGFDVQRDPEDEEGWLFVAILTVAESFELSRDARDHMLSDLEGIFDDEIKPRLAEAGFDMDCYNGEDVRIVV
jgi:hypothetical protein